MLRAWLIVLRVAVAVGDWRQTIEGFGKTYSRQREPQCLVRRAGLGMNSTAPVRRSANVRATDPEDEWVLPEAIPTESIGNTRQRTHTLFPKPSPKLSVQKRQERRLSPKATPEPSSAKMRKQRVCFLATVPGGLPRETLGKDPSTRGRTGSQSCERASWEWLAFGRNCSHSLAIGFGLEEWISSCGSECERQTVGGLTFSDCSRPRPHGPAVRARESFCEGGGGGRKPQG